MKQQRPLPGREHRCRIECPACGATVEPRPIVWGYPTAATMAAAERGDVVLGGCLVGELDPSHQCPACDARLLELEHGHFVLMVPAAPWLWPFSGDGPVLH